MGCKSLAVGRVVFKDMQKRTFLWRGLEGSVPPNWNCRKCGEHHRTPYIGQPNDNGSIFMISAERSPSYPKLRSATTLSFKRRRDLTHRLQSWTASITVFAGHNRLMRQ